MSNLRIKDSYTWGDSLETEPAIYDKYAMEEANTAYWKSIPHWTESGREACYFCKERCDLISLDIDGTIREQNCGKWGKEFADLNQPHIKVIVRKKAEETK